MEKPNDLTREDEEEDNISLSGLFMYSDKNIEVGSVSSGYNSDQDFEFSSDMLITSRHHHDSSTKSNVIFCGKIIHISPPPRESKIMGMKPKQLQEVTKTNKSPRWLVLMFGFGSARYPNKKIEIRDLKERQTSSAKTIKSSCCGDYWIRQHHEMEVEDRIRMKSGGWIRFLGCGGGGTEIDHHPPSQLYY